MNPRSPFRSLSSKRLVEVRRIDPDDPELENIEDDDEYEAVADAFDEWMDTQDFEDLDEE